MTVEKTVGRGSRVSRTVRTGRTAKAAALLAGFVAIAGSATIDQSVAQAQATSTPIGYTAQQATRGAKGYMDNCGGCHGDRLQGAIDAPPLAGAPFREKWFGQPVGMLHDYMLTYMPQDRPGQLAPALYADIFSFILKTNGVAAGEEAMPEGAIGSLMDRTFPVSATP